MLAVTYFEELGDETGLGKQLERRIGGRIQ